MARTVLSCRHDPGRSLVAAESVCVLSCHQQPGWQVLAACYRRLVCCVACCGRINLLASSRLAWLALRYGCGAAACQRRRPPSTRKWCEDGASDCRIFQPQQRHLRSVCLGCSALGLQQRCCCSLCAGCVLRVHTSCKPVLFGPSVQVSGSLGALPCCLRLRSAPSSKTCFCVLSLASVLEDRR